MSIKISVPSYLLPYTNNMEVVEVNGSTVGECLDQMIKQLPGMEQMLFTQNSNLLSYVGIYVNREDAYPEMSAKPVKDGDELDILYIIGGG